jgi:hypothetical protein
VVKTRKKKYFVKWRGLSHRDNTWESAKDINDDVKIAEFHRINDAPPDEPPLTQAEIGVELSKDKLKLYPATVRPNPVQDLGRCFLSLSLSLSLSLLLFCTESLTLSFSLSFSLSLSLIIYLDATIYAQMRTLHFLKWDKIAPDALLKESGPETMAYSIGARCPVVLPAYIKVRCPNPNPNPNPDLI